MSYETSSRMPPRQQRWPDATPGEAWPAYLDGGGYRGGGRQASGGHARAPWDYAQAPSGYAEAPAGYPGYAPAGYAQPSGGYGPALDGYRQAPGGYGQPEFWPGPEPGYRDTAVGYADPPPGYGDTAVGYADPPGYRDTAVGYADPSPGYPGGGYAGAADDFDGAAGGYPGAADDFDGFAGGYGETDDGYEMAGGHAGGEYGDAGRRWDGYDDTGHGYDYGGDGYARERDDFPGADFVGGYAGLTASGDLLEAPDLAEPGWLSGPGDGSGSDRGLIAAAMTGLLAAAVAIGVATLAAAFVRPQASPAVAMGSVFMDRIPAALRTFAVDHFGTHDKTVLLFGMYATIAVIAVVIGCLARRSAAIGVAGLTALGLIGAFVAITRPESRATDVIPSVVGGIVGVIAFAWLARAAAPVTPPYRSADGRRMAR